MALTKENKYLELLPRIEALLEGESNCVANMANMVAAIHETMGFFWTGFYLVDGETLVLGPFQGPVACTRIPFGKGVCGTAWMREESIIVPDVEEFPGHIACSSLSRSEIVVPVKDVKGDIVAILDIDSKELSTFDSIDEKYLKQIVLFLHL